MDFNNTYEFIEYAKYCFGYICNIMNLDQSFYNLTFIPKSNNGSYGRFRFPNTIIIFTDIYKTIAQVDINSAKFMLIETIIHELYHSLQNIAFYKDNNMNSDLEDSVEALSIQFILGNIHDIENNLDIVIKSNDINIILDNIKNPDAEYIKRDYLYIYKSIIQYIAYDRMDDFEKIYYTNKNISFIIQDAVNDYTHSFCIKKNNILQDPNCLLNFLINNNFYNYSNMNRIVRFIQLSYGYCINIIITSGTIKPILKG